MQCYPGRGNPVVEALNGNISIRELRVMVENLPPENAVAHAINGPWLDAMRILHSIDSRLANLNASYFNTNRDKGQAAITPEFMPTPEDRQQAADPDRSPEQVQQERDHLQAVLARSNPQ